ncbi:MAG: MFS transporter [Geminicoccaceae bacterium]|nr:MFS transporter [Geminicoccaceae bacterium]
MHDRPVIVALGAISVFVSIGFGILSPAVPTMMADLSLSQTTISFLYTGALTLIALTSLVTGALVDRFGVRPLINAGLGIFIVSGILAALAGNAYLLLFGRAMQAAGSAAGLTAARVAIRIMFDRRRSMRILSFYAFWMIASGIVAPVMGGWITELYSWRLIFVIEALLALPCLIILNRRHFLPSRATSGGMPDNDACHLPLKQQFSVLLMPAFALVVILHTASSTLILAEAIWTPQWASNVHHLSPSEIGMWRVVLSTSMAIGCIIPARFPMPGRDSLLALLAIALSVVAVPVFLTSVELFNHPAALFFPAGIFAMSCGIILAIAPNWCMWLVPGMSGTSVGVMTCTVGLVSAAAIQTLAVIMGNDPIPLLMTAVIVCAAVELAVGVALVLSGMTSSDTAASGIPSVAGDGKPRHGVDCGEPRQPLSSTKRGTRGIASCP